MLESIFDSVQATHVVDRVGLDSVVDELWGFGKGLDGERPLVLVGRQGDASGEWLHEVVSTLYIKSSNGTLTLSKALPKTV